MKQSCKRAQWFGGAEGHICSDSHGGPIRGGVGASLKNLTGDPTDQKYVLRSGVNPNSHRVRAVAAPTLYRSWKEGIPIASVRLPTYTQVSANT